MPGRVGDHGDPVALQLSRVRLQQRAIAGEEHHPLAELDQRQRQPVHTHRSGVPVAGDQPRGDGRLLRTQRQHLEFPLRGSAFGSRDDLLVPLRGQRAVRGTHQGQIWINQHAELGQFRQQRIGGDAEQVGVRRAQPHPPPTLWCFPQRLDNSRARPRFAGDERSDGDVLPQDRDVAKRAPQQRLELRLGELPDVEEVVVAVLVAVRIHIGCAGQNSPPGTSSRVTTAISRSSSGCTPPGSRTGRWPRSAIRATVGLGSPGYPPGRRTTCRFGTARSG